MTDKTELEKLTEPVSRPEAKALVPSDLLDRATVLAAAFPDVKTAGEAMVKIEIGASLGFGDAASMVNIHLYQGKPIVGYAMLGAAVKRHEKYDYTLLSLTNEACEIEFFEFVGDERLTIGKSSYTMEDAKTAKLSGKDNYEKHPRNMLFARAMSNGVKWFCPDAVGGAVYVMEERDLIRAEAREERETPPEPVVTITKEEAEEVEGLMLGACNGPGDMAMLLLAQNADACEDLTPEGVEAIRRVLVERAGEPEENEVVDGEVVNDG